MVSDRRLHLLRRYQMLHFQQQGGDQGGAVEYVHVLRHTLGGQTKGGTPSEIAMCSKSGGSNSCCPQ